MAQLKYAVLWDNVYLLPQINNVKVTEGKFILQKPVKIKKKTRKKIFQKKL